MNIIITFIPGSTTMQQLERFVLSGLGLPLAFWNKSKLRHCDILNILDQDTGGRESHGVAYFTSDEAAEKAIKSLDGKTLNGKPVHVHKFYYRRPGDQRKTQGSHKGKNLMQDSRRPHLIVRSLALGNQPISGETRLMERKIFEDGPERKLDWESVALPDAADAPTNRSTIQLDQREQASPAATVRQPTKTPAAIPEEVIDLSHQLHEPGPKDGGK
jgi:hypothetical protein